MSIGRLSSAKVWANTRGCFPRFGNFVARTFSAGQVVAASNMAERFLQSAELQDDRQLRMIGHRLCGMTQFGRGALLRAQRHIETALELYNPEKDAPLRHIYAFDQKSQRSHILRVYYSNLDFLIRRCGYPSAPS